MCFERFSLPILMVQKEKPDPGGEFEGFHVDRTPDELLFRVNGSNIISSIPDHWKPGTNVLTHHKGKESDTHTHTQSICTSLQNLSKSFKLCYDSCFQSIKEFSPKSQQLLCLYHPVMSWIGWIKMMEGEMTSVLAERKIWISQTNHGKNDKKFGSTLISFLLQRKFGPPPGSSMALLFFLYKK